MKSLVYFLFSDLCQVLKTLGTSKVLKAQEWTGFGQESHDMPRKKTSGPDPGFDFCPLLCQCCHLSPYRGGVSVLL